VIPNQNLFRIANEKTTFADAFAMADDVLHSGVRGVTDLMVVPGLINLDFADVKTIMAGMGMAIMGTGTAEGETRALDTANFAISSPQLEDASVKGARGVIINVTGGPDLSLLEVNEASSVIQEAAHEDANIIFGAVVDPKMKGKVKITVIATGFDRARAAQAPSGSTSQTPVDLTAYASWREPEERLAAAGGSRLSIVRRHGLDLPVMPPAPPVDQASEGPGAEFEPASPLDVPAFLRRQSEA